MTIRPDSDVHDWIHEIHPAARGCFMSVASACVEDFANGKIATYFRPYEAYRSPDRQNDLYKMGSSKARAWQSAHQYGLALDMVPWTAAEGWSWDDKHDYAGLRAIARRFGLDVPIVWDRVHVESPLFRTMKAAIRS